MSSKITISKDTVVSRSPEQLSCKLDDETIILKPANGAYFKLNKIGTRIWEIIETSHRVEDLVDILREEFAVDRDCCEQDVIAFLTSILGNELGVEQPA